MYKILIIIQRSNGDVFLSSPLIEKLYTYYHYPYIDLLINDDTISIARTLPYIHHIHMFSYAEKKHHKWRQEKHIITSIYKKYDLSINLTTSDRSVLYAILAGKISISVVESNTTKSWWKRLFLNHYYHFRNNESIVTNNLTSLTFLNIDRFPIYIKAYHSHQAKQSIQAKLKQLGIKKFIIFHPLAQYSYKMYPPFLRTQLLHLLHRLDIDIVVTGATHTTHNKIANTIPQLSNIYNVIGHTSLDEYIALSALSEGYVGMDTLNMHIAAAQNKRVFAIFGPTLVSIWSPWSNTLQTNTKTNATTQTYDNITLFQADMDCVACGNAGCKDDHGESVCLKHINPQTIYNEIEQWLST